MLEACETQALCRNGNPSFVKTTEGKKSDTALKNLPSRSKKSA